MHVLFLSHVSQFEYLAEHNSEHLSPVYELFIQFESLSKHVPFISQPPGQLPHDSLQNPP